MLRITIPEQELFDERTNEFVFIKGRVLKMEHSLLSLTKWESRWHKAFLDPKGHNREEMNDYYYCMCIDGNVDKSVFDFLPSDVVSKIDQYIQDPMTATTFSNRSSKTSSEIITSEVFYYYMIQLSIPIEVFEKRHLNHLMTLINVFDAKSSGKKKSVRDVMNENRALNAARIAKTHSRG